MGLRGLQKMLTPCVAAWQHVNGPHVNAANGLPSGYLFENASVLGESLMMLMSRAAPAPSGVMVTRTTSSIRVQHTRIPDRDDCNPRSYNEYFEFNITQEVQVGHERHD